MEKATLLIKKNPLSPHKANKRCGVPILINSNAFRGLKDEVPSHLCIEKSVVFFSCAFRRKGDDLSQGTGSILTANDYLFWKDLSPR